MMNYTYDDSSGLVLGYDPLEPEVALEQYPATDLGDANQLICKLYFDQEDIRNSPLKQYIDILLHSKKTTTIESMRHADFWSHQAYGAVMYHAMEHPEDEIVWFHLWTNHYYAQFWFH